ncbi:hypothetical protein EBU94_08450, partial [bacterium]|nr:hypothetical protein [bacterium]
KPEKAIRRIIKRERDKGVRDGKIKSRLQGLPNDAFYTRPESELDKTAKIYADKPEYIASVKKRQEEIDAIINRELP